MNFVLLTAGDHPRFLDGTDDPNLAEAAGPAVLIAVGALLAGAAGGLLAGVDWTRIRPRHEVVLLTKPGCHLCDDARAVVTDHHVGG